MDEHQRILDESKLVKLMSVESDMDAEFNISLLKSTGIEAIKRFKGSGSYLNITQGRNYQGIDLYVLETDMDEAKSIIEAEVVFDQETIPEELMTDRDDESLMGKYKDDAKVKTARGLLWLMGGGIMILIVASFLVNR